MCPVRVRRRDRGMVVAELACALPALALVLTVALAGLGLGLDQIRCVDGARLAARSLARGDSVTEAVRLAAAAAPAGFGVVVAQAGDDVVATVTGVRAGPAGLGSVRLSAQARAAKEHAP